MAISQGFASIGSFLEFSSVLPVEQDVASFAALTWVESNEETQLGEIGNTNEVLTYNTVKDGRVNKRLGSADSGQLSAEFAFDSKNAAQELLRVANRTQDPIAVKEVLANGDVYYFIVFVSSFVTATGDTSSITMLKCNLEITSEIVEDLVA